VIFNGLHPCIGSTGSSVGAFVENALGAYFEPKSELTFEMLEKGLTMPGAYVGISEQDKHLITRNWRCM